MTKNEHIHRGYKITSMGILPQEWEIKQIRDIGKVVTGSTPPTNDDTYWGSEYLFVTPADMGDSKYITDTERKLSLKGFSASRKLPQGSILFICIGSTIGKMGIATIELTSNQQINAIICNKINIEFLFYRLLYQRNRIRLLAGEQAVPIINKSDFERIQLVIPPIDEQKKIVAILSEWDKAIELQTKLIEKLELRKRALMQRLLTGRVRLNGLHKEWNCVKAGEIFYNSTKRASDGDQLLSSTQENGVIPRTMLDTRVTMPSGNAIENFKSVEPGDFIISLRSFQGGIEYSNYGGCVSPAYTVLKPKHIINKVFYQYYFKSVEFINRLAVAVIGIRDGRQINFNDFSFVKIPEPSLEEQDAIAKIFTTTDKEIDKEKLKLSSLRNQKRGLMQQLLTGKKRIKIWQKN